MKKLFLSAIVSLVLTASARANTYTDNNPANVLLTFGDNSYTGQFTLADYNPAAETITSAYAEFSFLGIALDSFKITMAGDIRSHGSFFGSLVFGIDDAVNAWGILDSTGVLSYTVALTAGSRYESLLLTNASLTAETTSRSSVPDAGATSILLGLGVIGILGAKRRFASVA
jgi:VPDSG-CTERM motif